MAELLEERTQSAFPELDVALITKELNVQKRGNDDGHRDIPSSLATNLSAAESDILAHFADLVADAKSSARHLLSEIRQRMFDGNLSGSLDHVRATPRQLGTAFETAKQKHREDLRDRSLFEAEARSSLRRFKSEHGLTRQAKQKKDYFTQLFLFLLFVILEACLNAWFFALASDKGLLGGFLTAGIVSLINVTAGFLAGYFAITSLYHKSVVRKTLGTLLLSGCVIFCLSVNLFAGHYRSALEKDPLSAVNVAVESFKVNWVGIDSVQGWILCAFGILLAILFAIKSFFYDDPYPGYSERYREHRKAKDDLMSAEQSFTNDIDDIGNDFRNKIGERMNDAARQAKDLEKLISQSKSMVDRFSNFSQRAATVCNQVVSGYRKANTDVRESKPPSHFGETAELPFASEIIEIDFDDREARLGAFQKSLDDFRDTELPGVKEEIDRAIHEQISSLEVFFSSLRSQRSEETTQ